MSTPLAPVPLQIVYVDPDGGSWNLSDLSMSNGYACTGLAGIEGVPVFMQTVPLLDGTAVPNIYIPQPGSIAMGVLLGWPIGGAESDYYALLDRFVRACINRRSEVPVPSYLQIQRPDGSVRQIAVYVTSGLNTPEVSIHTTMYTLTLATPDPYWSDLSPQQLLFSISGSAGILPVLPVILSSSSIIGNAVINNAGSAIAWPTWTITGPGLPTVQNFTTGRKWSLNATIPGGQVVQVTTKPGTQSVVNLTTGVNIWDQLVLSSLRDLWGFTGGNNQVNIAMAGSSVSSSVAVTWTNRWSRA